MTSELTVSRHIWQKSLEGTTQKQCYGNLISKQGRYKTQQWQQSASSAEKKGEREYDIISRKISPTTKAEILISWYNPVSKSSFHWKALHKLILESTTNNHAWILDQYLRGKSLWGLSALGYLVVTRNSVDIKNRLL